MNYYKNGTFFAIEKHSGNVLSVDEHFHGLYEFYYLKCGTAIYLINDKIYHLAKGDVVVIPPNTLHKTISATHEERERILFYLDKSFFTHIISAGALLPCIPLLCHTDAHSRISGVFEDLLAEFNLQNDQLYLETLISELLHRLERTAKNTLSEYGYQTPQDIIAKILLYITSNFSSELTLKDTAKHFYVNPSYLSRSFKERTGFTFCNYLNNFRIKEANKLLSETDQKITDIALLCGFNSLNNFCKCYKKIMKMTPLAYRKQVKK